MEHLGNSDHNMVTFSVHHEQEILDSTTLFHDYCKSIRKELADIDWDVFIHPSIHHLFKQNEQTYKQSKSIQKHIQYRARCQGTHRAV